MPITRLSDVVVPVEFTDYITQETMERTALVQSGAMLRNAAIDAQLQAGSQAFTIPFWNDLGNEEADVTNDDPEDFSTPQKVGAGSQLIRKAFLHQSWSAMNLASELAGSSAADRIRGRVRAYWERQLQRRMIASLNGILADNVANDSSDMVLDISALTGGAEFFSPEAVIDATAELGDALSNITGIAMHSDIYREALKADLIETIRNSDGSMFNTYRGLAVVMDDGLPVSGGNYTTVLFGRGAVGYGLAEPREAPGTEVENIPSAGNGGGQVVLHSRNNVALHPLGFTWVEGVDVEEGGPTLAQLAQAAHWNRVLERKAIPLAFLISK